MGMGPLYSVTYDISSIGFGQPLQVLLMGAGGGWGATKRPCSASWSLNNVNIDTRGDDLVIVYLGH